MKTVTAVQTFLANRRAINRRAETLRWYESKLKRFAAAFPELPTEPEPIEEFLAAVVPPQKDESRHGFYRALKALYRFICRRNRLPNPIALIDPPSRRKKVRPTLSSHEMMLLLASAQNLRDRAILSLFIDTGARLGEVASLRKQNISDDCIRVDGKTGQREIPISEETRRLLLMLAANTADSDYVFHGRRGPLTRWGIYRIVKNHMRRAGIAAPKLGPHRLRHAFAKHYIKNGGDTRSLQKIMGHASISTTEIYVELAREDIIAKHHQFTPLRSAYAAAQQSFFDKSLVLKEAEEILAGKGGINNDNDYELGKQ
ncbi:MAG: tyrosine-type recombinase/integrase [Dehalococcoidales bacterium]|nr:tyrosine-type recombinase/integrase [Dehalococcoidales bacterium]